MKKIKVNVSDDDYSNVRITVPTPQYLCPKHGETDQFIHFIFADKKYCSLCWQEWMEINIPEVIPR